MKRHRRTFARLLAQAGELLSQHTVTQVEESRGIDWGGALRVGFFSALPPEVGNGSAEGIVTAEVDADMNRFGSDQRRVDDDRQCKRVMQCAADPHRVAMQLLVEPQPI